MKTPLTLLLAVLFTPFHAQADISDCAKYVGNWTTTTNFVPYNNIVISVDPTHLILDFDPNTNGYSTSLIADGLEHPGVNPENDGATYTATCTEDSITLVRNFTGLASPMISVFTLNDDNVLSYENTIGSSSQSFGDFERTQD